MSCSSLVPKVSRYLNQNGGWPVPPTLFYKQSNQLKMLLQQVAHFNDLSPKLRETLENKVRGFGKQVRYKFDISHQNPDPTFHNGKILYPNIYTLDPTVW